MVTDAAVKIVSYSGVKCFVAALDDIDEPRHNYKEFCTKDAPSCFAELREAFQSFISLMK